MEKMGHIQKLHFNVSKEPVSITSEEDTTLSYKLNDKTTQVKLKQGKTKTLDDFPVGIYDLKATQKVDNKNSTALFISICLKVTVQIYSSNKTFYS